MKYRWLVGSLESQIKVEKKIWIHILYLLFILLISFTYKTFLHSHTSLAFIFELKDKSKIFCLKWGCTVWNWIFLRHRIHCSNEGCAQQDFFQKQCSWAIIFRRLFSKRCTFGSKSETKSLLRWYQAKFAKTVPEHLKVCHILYIWLKWFVCI